MPVTAARLLIVCNKSFKKCSGLSLVVFLLEGRYSLVVVHSILQFKLHVVFASLKLSDLSFICKNTGKSMWKDHKWWKMSRRTKSILRQDLNRHLRVGYLMRIS